MRVEDTLCCVSECGNCSCRAATGLKTAGTKRKVCTCTDHHITVGPAARVGVGYDVTVEAPLVMKDLLKKTVRATCPAGTDLVKRGHDTHGVCFLNANLPRSDVDLTHSLLVKPCKKTATVSLLIVYTEVLNVTDKTLGLCTVDHSCRHLTCKPTILGEVLEVTAGEGRTVNVYCGSIPEGNVLRAVAPKSLVTHCNALCSGELGVPGGGKNGLTAPGRICATGSTVEPACRAVCVCNSGNTVLRPVLTGSIATVHCKISKLGRSELIHEEIPLGIVIFYTNKVEECKAVACACGRHFLGIPRSILRINCSTLIKIYCID